MAEQLFGAILHAVHEGVCMLVVHVVHDVEVTHLVIGGTPAGELRAHVEGALRKGKMA